MVYIFFLRLSVQPFLGLVREADCPPMCLCLLYGATLISLFGCFFLIRYSTPWIFSCTSFSSISDMEILLRTPLRSWGSFGWSKYLKFLGGFPKWLAYFLSLYRAIWLVCTARYPQGYPLLSPYLRPYDCSSGGASAGSCLSLSSLWW